ncbi:hypothetical protein SAMN04490243_2256 [Robiginitalea myxolifaciens]|uniref:DUF4350 domain-containing protein n=1 Tax=Robiginitalea myxolifaciens TaxID=400055 RepID=A0A1I6H4S4_9FLAO|nr:DUF4350 domain-containing protein [Robiginitalea myxolifaciens]SFR49428.1 hypothetical protein SAMN04490243_2256 [Robiginitalea myxolifaciens]
MSKANKIIVALFGLAVLGILIAEIARPQPINWRADFTRAGKGPFGCFVMYSELPGLFSNRDIEPIGQDLYYWLTHRDTVNNSSLVVINNQTNFDPALTRALLAHVSKGNTAFVSSAYIGPTLEDTLNLRLQTGYSLIEQGIELELAYDGFSPDRFKYTKGYLRNYFELTDSTNAEVLGWLHLPEEEESDWEGDTDLDSLLTDPFGDESLDEVELSELESAPLLEAPNFLRIPFGQGTLLLHSTPYAFGNYYMLGGNEAYVAGVLSYLEDQTIYWDNNLKSGRRVVDSPLRFVLSQAPLRWAYYILIITLLLFVLVRSRRVQRIIPVVTPLENTSIAYTQTVGDLYFEQRDYADIIAKRLSYFREMLHSRFGITRQREGDEALERLAHKSGLDPEYIAQTFAFIHQVEKKKYPDNNDLIKLHELLKPFNS